MQPKRTSHIFIALCTIHFPSGSIQTTRNTDSANGQEVLLHLKIDHHTTNCDKEMQRTHSRTRPCPTQAMSH